MENQYGITIRNKYDLFLNDQDPLEILQLQEQLKAAKKTEKAKKSTTAVTGVAGDKDSKSAKNKQIKAAAVVVTQEVKAEKAETTTTTSLPQKKEDKPKRTKPSRVEDGTQPDTKPRERQPGKTGSVAQKSKEDTFSSPTEFGNQTEFGHFEVRPNDRSGNRERRTRDGYGDRPERGVSSRDRGEGGFGSSSRPDGRERSDRGGFGRERRPRGRYMGGRPPRRGGYSDDRQRGGVLGENQERGLLTEGDHGGPGFGEGRGFSEHPGDKAGFSDQYERKNLDEYGRRGVGGGGFDDRGGFDNERHFEVRQERGNFEQRTFESRRGNYVERRNYEGRQDRGGFGERRRGGFGEQENQSFGHWSEKSGDGEEREIRRGGRGGFGRRGRGRGRPGFGRREFGRQGDETDQSGGVRGTEKREGSSASNWGTAMDDLEGHAGNQNAVDGATWGEQAEAAEIQEASGANSARVAEEKGDGTNVEESAEEEPQVMTLDEWKALQAAKRVKPEYNIRQPGEGCSDAQWKKMFLLTKKIEEHPSEEEDAVEFEEDKHTKPKNVLPIKITFTDNPRRGGRGSRRGGSSRGGGGGRGFPFDGSGYHSDMRKSPSSRGDREGGGGRRGARERAPNMADEHDFPSLDKAVPVH